MRFILIFLAAFCVSASGLTIHIPFDYPFIQAGVDASMNGDTVVVHPGVYSENLLLEDKNIVLTSLYSITGDTSAIDSTIIQAENSEGTVLFISGPEINASTVLSGFTIQDGHSTYGGGIRCNDASPRLEYLVVKENSCTTGGGGGIMLEESSATLLECHITNNLSEDVAGGIYLKHCENIILQNTIISSNTAAITGGGLFIRACDSVTVSGCLISNNITSTSGGGVVNRSTFVILEKTTITGNHAETLGGGVYSYESGITHVINTIVWDNSPNTAAFAPTSDSGNELRVAFSDMEDGEDGVVTNGRGTVSWLEGNLELDPGFSTDSTFTLLATSPCIDGGTNAFSFADGTELFYSIWEYAGLNPDMGFDEVGPPNNAPPLDFSLILPINGTQLDSVDQPFVWFPTIDLEGEPIEYLLVLEGTRDTILVCGVNSSIYTFEGEDFYTPNGMYSWYILATDGIDTTRSTETYTIYTSPTLDIEPYIGPAVFDLSGAYPNPFNPFTTISYSLPPCVYHSLVIYNIGGREVKSLQRGHQVATNFNVVWDGTNNSGTPVGTGVYFAHLSSGSNHKTIKLTLLK